MRDKFAHQRRFSAAGIDAVTPVLSDDPRMVAIAHGCEERGGAKLRAPGFGCPALASFILRERHRIHCDAVFTIEAAHPCGWIGLPAGRLSEGSRSSTLLGYGPEELASHSVPSTDVFALPARAWSSVSEQLSSRPGTDSPPQWWRKPLISFVRPRSC